MKISYSWLKEFINTDLSPENISKYLTDLGLEVESFSLFKPIKRNLNGVVIGQIIRVFQHPNADKLKVTEVKISENEILKIVCGAHNVRVNQKVAVATLGAKLFIKNSLLKISKCKIRGEESFGVLCSEDELGIGNNSLELKIFDDSVLIGTHLSEYLDLEEDFIFEIGLTPNRSDAMSHFGVARDLNVVLSYKKKFVEFFKPIYQKIIPLTIETNHAFVIQIEDSNLCNRYSGVVLENISVQESPIWLQNRLKSIGLEPINNLVDVTNYVMHHLGQPIHIFDANKISRRTIKIGMCPRGTEFITVDGIIRKLNGEELMIKDGDDIPLGIAGICGSKNSEITSETTSVFLESAYFNPISIRKTSKVHSIHNGSSFRFERGVDPNLTINALELGVEIIQKISKNSLVVFFNDEYSNPIINKKVIFRYHKIDELLGHKIHREEIKKIIHLLEIDILAEFNDNLELEIKSYRNDVVREIDVIEEILRIYGYNSVPLPQKIQFSKNSVHLNDRLKLEKRLANLLVFNGFYESMNNSLISLDESLHNRIELLNPLSKDLAMMRNQLTSSLLGNIAFNLNRKQSSIKLFEFGKSYTKINKNFIETNLLSLVMCGKSNHENWITPSSKVSFFDLRGIAEQLLDSIGIGNYCEIFFSDEIYSEGIRFYKNNLLILNLGILNEELCSKNDVRKSVFSADFYLDSLQKLSIRSKKFTETIKFPSSKRDLDLIIDKHITYNEIKNIAFDAEKKILKNVQLFDVYEGEKIPKNKKSYSVSFYLQDNDKTLTYKQIDLCMEKIFNQLSRKIQATLRS